MMYHGHFPAYEMGQKNKNKTSAAKSRSISSRLLLCHLAFLWYFFSLHTMYLTKYIRGKRPTKETRNLLRKARISNKNNAWSS